nr:hypothetical protein [uncultured Allomuricauda sp.]
MKKLHHLLLLLLPVLLLGQEIPGKKQFVHSVEIADSQENIWNALTDFSNFKLWDENVVDVRCDGALKKRQNCQVIVENGKIFEVEILEIVDQESYTVRYQLNTGMVYIKRRISPGTPLQLSETVWYKGMSKKTFEKYKGTAYAELQRKRLAGLKTYLEQEGQQGK